MSSRKDEFAEYLLQKAEAEDVRRRIDEQRTITIQSSTRATRVFVVKDIFDPDEVLRRSEMERRLKDEQLAKEKERQEKEKERLEKERIRIEKLNEIQNQNLEMIKKLIRASYSHYFKEFNILRENAKQLQAQMIQQRMFTMDQIEEAKRCFIREKTEKWPQPYRSLCTFEVGELVCFDMFPIDTRFLVCLQQPIR